MSCLVEQDVNNNKTPQNKTTNLLYKKDLIIEIKYLGKILKF
jgi:hypothetical protein